MPDVRDILTEGADVPPGLPDVPDLMRRGRTARRRRTAVLASAAAAVVIGVGVLGATVMPLRSDPGPAPATSSQAEPVPSTPGPLAPGSYDASSVGLDVSFTVPGPGWTLTTVEDGWVGLRHERSSVVLQRWDEVVDPGADPVGPTDTMAVPTDLVAWLTSHPRLDVAGVSAVRLGQEAWTAVELTVVDPLTTPPAECNTLRCVLLAVSGDEPTELLARDRTRIVVAPGPRDEGDPVVILSRPAAEARPDADAEALTASLEPR